MNYMVIINNMQMGNVSLEAMDIVVTLFDAATWLFSPRTAKVQSLVPGDKFVVYMAGQQNKCFVGTFTLETAPTEFNSNPEGLENLLKYFSLSSKIKDVSLWPTPVPIRSILVDLTFIVDKKNYGLYLRQGIRQLSEADFDIIVGYHNLYYSTKKL